MSVRSRQVPLVKYTDPQLKAGEHPLPDRLYTGLIWCLLLFVCLGGCLYYVMTKPIIITSANVSGEEHYDLNEMITLSVNPSDTENCVIFSVPAGVQASDIVTENLYNEKRFLVHINTDSDRFYGSLNDSGISVDAGRISGDASLVANASVIYDRTGALLVFDLTVVYEYTLEVQIQKH